MTASQLMVPRPSTPRTGNNLKLEQIGNMVRNTALSGDIRVALADDHVLVRSGVKALLDSVPGVTVVAEAGDGAELLDLLASEPVDVVLMDLSMPGMDGLSAIAHVRRQHPSTQILVLSMHGSADVVKRAATAGACGYITKEASNHELVQALRTVRATGSYFTSAVSLLLLQPAPREASDDLTERQVEVLTLLARGKAAKEIGFELGLSARTVDVHRARIMKRLEMNNMAGLTRYALRKGLIEA
ncbi:MAG: putative response regulator, NarL [Ramlibacter sp.]|jgi:DNA-binding NarL/FixJ family response regulator|uniref:response regulator transcription factor n=1 Tax=Ramlibacter sp. TaxID=1917967 RepID=UPI002615ADA9|nr:response regulator transcription factor [Ramlibacter sp.]MDB5752993.1 putative response regulator, NarL [Ramlibacter sp.]